MEESSQKKHLEEKLSSSFNNLVNVKTNEAEKERERAKKTLPCVTTFAGCENFMRFFHHSATF